MLMEWVVDKIVHFESGDFVRNGLSHFGFHDRRGNHYAIFHQKHFLGLIGRNSKLKWTVAGHQVFPETPNIIAELNYPMYIDNLKDKTLLVSNFGDARIFRIDVEKMKTELFVDGSKIGMKDVGNCVVDNEDTVWVNEVEGCRIWRFDNTGKPVLTLGDGVPGLD